MTIKKYFYNCCYCQRRLLATEFDFQNQGRKYGLAHCPDCCALMNLVKYDLQSIENPVDAIAIPHENYSSEEATQIVWKWLAAIGELGVEQVDHDEFSRRYAEVDGHCIEIDIE